LETDQVRDPSGWPPATDNPIEATCHERSLLRSAHGDAPTAKSRRRTLVALGLAGGVGGATTATATSTAAVALKSSAAVGGATLVKWIGVGVLTGAVVIGAATVVPKKAPARAPVTMGGDPPYPPAQPASAAPIASPTPPVAPTQAEPPPPPPSPPSPATAPSEEPAPKPAAPAPVAQPAATSLTYEVAALDHAREALVSGDAGGALRALDDHDRRFPGGMLGPEATVLRIEALALRGDRASAVRLGKAFLDAHPRSPHASRLRSLLGLDAPAPPSPANPESPKPPAAAP